MSSLPQQAIEQRLLVDAILRVLAMQSTGVTTSPLTQMTADERATRINALQQQPLLSKQDVKELLSACLDTRRTTKEAWEKITKKVEDWRSEGDVVGEFAWGLLSQSWEMDAEAEMFVVQALDEQNALLCAGAARLLQYTKKLAKSERIKAAEKIIAILKDEKLSRRPLDIPGADYTMWRLDDVLFGALRALVE